MLNAHDKISSLQLVDGRVFVQVAVFASLLLWT